MVLMSGSTNIWSALTVRRPCPLGTHSPEGKTDVPREVAYDSYGRSFLIIVPRGTPQLPGTPCKAPYLLRFQVIAQNTPDYFLDRLAWNFFQLNVWG